MRYSFNDVFNENPDGSLTPLRTIQIGGVTMGSSITFRNGVSFSGINIYDYYGADIEADEERGILVIRGFYR